VPIQSYTKWMPLTTKTYYGIHNPTYKRHQKNLNYRKHGKLRQWVANTTSSIEVQIQSTFGARSPWGTTNCNLLEVKLMVNFHYLQCVPWNTHLQWQATLYLLDKDAKILKESMANGRKCVQQQWKLTKKVTSCIYKKN
jgi:hypothetical protein